MDSATVFEMRKKAKELEGNLKLNKLNEILNIANLLYKEQPYDEWNQRALGWTLIDLCKFFISINNFNQAAIYLKQLLSINFDIKDEIIEKEKKNLKTKMDIVYKDIKTAEDFSKNGNHQEAMNIFSILLKENRLTEMYHESYGWVIYRYIKSDDNKLTSVQIKTLLMEYMRLKNEKPSLLHSMILNFALNYSKNHTDFDLYKFFKFWNPKYFTTDDKENIRKDGKEIRSLVARILTEFIEKELDIDIEYLIETIKLKADEYRTHTISSKKKILEILREAYFWKIFNTKKENRNSDLWKYFENYNKLFSKYEATKWNSEILKLAEQYMIENEAWRFLEFFKRWNPDNFLEEDWLEVKKDEHCYKGLAIKGIKKAFEIIEESNLELDLEWLINAYNVAISKFPNDAWLKRQQALLFIKTSNFNSAICIYNSLILELGDKAYIWSEFASCFNTNIELKIGMLSKAIQLENNEDFLGDIRLELSRLLIENNLLENAAIELSIYKAHREAKDWKLSKIYNELAEKTANILISIKNNKDIYERFIPFAEKIAYQNIKWTEVVLVDIWKNDKEKEKVTFANGRGMCFSVSKQRDKLLRNAKIGNIFEFKLHPKKREVSTNNDSSSYIYSNVKIEYDYIPLLLKDSEKDDWSILADEFAIIDYINSEKNIIHMISTRNEEIFFKDETNKYRVNDFITGKRLVIEKRDEIKIELKKISKIEKENAIDKFQKYLVIVDNVNQERNLFHYVFNGRIQDVVKFDETHLRPNEGDFLEIWLVEKTDKKRNKISYKAIHIKETEETTSNLMKIIQGEIKLNYKNSNTEPDFGFLDDVYVPKYVLKNNNIVNECYVKARAIMTGDKWRVLEILEKEIELQDENSGNEMDEFSF